MIGEPALRKGRPSVSGGYIDTPQSPTKLFRISADVNLAFFVIGPPAVASRGPPFVFWLVWWLVAKPQGKLKKKTKKKNWELALRRGVATVAPPLDISLKLPINP